MTATATLNLDPVAAALLSQLSPSGALTDLAITTNAERDKLDAEFDAIEKRIQAHLANETLVQRLEDDFAASVPLIADAAGPIESFLIPTLASLAGPAAAPFLSIGLQVACKVGVMLLQRWAASRKKT